MNSGTSNILKFLILISWFFIGNYISQGQGINNNWVIGYSSFAGPPHGNVNIDFSSGLPDLTYCQLPMQFNQTHANISDDQGNLLFYTNGVYIADASHDTMLNGSGLNPSDYTSSHQEGLLIPQASLIIKKPGSNSIYYLFHNTIDSFPSNWLCPHHLYLTTIDMNGNGGLGEVIQKNVPIINDTLSLGKLAATKHANGRDWWVVCRRNQSNMYYKLLVTPYGLPAVYSTQNIGPYKVNDIGQAKFSSNGYWFATHDSSFVDIYNFDRCTGSFSNHLNDFLLGPPGTNVGCEFSPYSDMLYVTNVTQVFQYSLGSSNIIGSRQLVATYDNFLDSIPGFPNVFGTYLCLPQLAPDGKIYITTGNGTRYFHTIHFPYFPGTACGLVQHDLNVPALYFNTIPNHPNYFLGKIPGSPCDTILSGIDDEKPTEIVLLGWPNPAHDFCTLTFPVQPEEGKLELYDLAGKKVLEEMVSPWSQIKKVSVEHLTSGMYMCRMQWGERSATLKILISSPTNH